MKENADKARSLDAAEINKLVRETGEQMFRLRFQMSMGQTDGVKKLRSLRKEKARMLTVLREREMGAAQVAPKPEHAKAVKTAAAGTKKAAPVAKPKAVAAPKTHAAGTRVKVKPTAAPKAAKVTTPRKMGGG
jgi:large subunit ribosomal protein L29